MDWLCITKDTPLEEVKRTHQQIWDYVIERGEKPLTSYVYGCAACEYVVKRSGCVNCMHCPIAWEDEKSCFAKQSLFDRWCDASERGRFDVMEAYAKQIRDMPFKYELEK